MLRFILSCVITASCNLLFIHHATAQSHSLKTKACMTIENPPLEMKRQIIIGNEDHSVTIVAEIALTHEERSRGLMCRTDLGELHGMIFFFNPPQIISMWMKNTPLALDMFFIAQNGEITQIIENTEPFSEKNIFSTHDTMFVLETKAGFAKHHKLKIGDRFLEINEIK